MPCCPCCSAKVVEEDQPLIVDVIPILQNKAWSGFLASQGSFKKLFIRRKDYEIEVPQNYFLFEQVEQSIVPKNSKLELNRSEEATPTKETTPLKTSSDLDIPSHRPSTNPEVVNVDTEFNNITAKLQTYDFRFAKERKSQISVSYQKGFTIGGKANFSIGTPKIMGGGEIGLETEMQYEVTNSKGQTFEETMSMDTTSKIQVGPDSKYVVNMQLEERAISANFKVVQRMSLPQKRAPVYVRRKSDNAVVSVYKVSNLKDVFVTKKVPCARAVVDEDGVKVPHMVDFVVEGTIKGSLSLTHKINLRSDETAEERKNAKDKMITMPGGVGEDG